MIPVTDLFDMLKKIQAEEWGYIYGQSGTLWTADRQKKATRTETVRYGSKWIGHMVADCSGLFVYIWRQHGLSLEHSSNAIARHACGDMSTKPKAGYAAFKWRKDGAPERWQDGRGDYYHIGFVAADEKTVYEEKGTSTGFTVSKTSSWDWFAPLNDVDYEAKGRDTMATYKAVVTTDKVNVRKAASKSSASLGKVNTGDIATVSGEENGWFKVSINKLNGYIYGQYLRKVIEPSGETEKVAIELDKETAQKVLEALQTALLVAAMN